MAKTIMIVGDTGTGKSTSIKTLNPKETVILAALNKDLPFKGSGKLYNIGNQNYRVVTDPNVLVSLLQKLPKARPDVKHLIIDDIGFIMQLEYFRKAAVVGYNKFTVMADNMRKIIETANNLESDVKIYFMFHEDVKDLSQDNTKRVKLIGKMLEDKYNPIATVTICLFTEVNITSEGIAEYKFVTNRSIDKLGRVIPAKSPDGMFEDLRIPNDLNFISKKIDEYYG